jgi:hypothetical protein
MFDPEYYIGVYEQRDTISGAKVNYSLIKFKKNKNYTFVLIKTKKIEQKDRKICRSNQLPITRGG